MPTCPLCQTVHVSPYAQAHDIEYFTSDEAFEFFRCAGCDIVFLHPMPFDRLGEIYPKNYYSFVSSDKSAIQRVKESLDRRYFRKVLAGMPGEKLSALDVGGGSGWLLDIVKAADPRVMDTWVVDIDGAARELAEAAGHSFLEGRIEDLPVERAFDVVLMLNLIEHVTDPRAVLRKAREALAPGGRIIIKTPNYDALDARLFHSSSWGGFHTPRHFVLFTRPSFAKLAQEVGLAVESFSYTQGAPFWSVSALDVLRRRGLVRVGKDRPAIYHPLIPVLQATFAAFDMARAPFAKLSQMQFVLRDP
jgi:2-polyprenyl-3-methyl-5-hydroxy-6-metoxy-1,4-benzoquinol methylase